MIHTATDEDFDSLVHDVGGLVLVDFSSRHCPPCRLQARVLQRFIETRPDVQVVEVDVERAPRTAVTYRIRATPTLLLFDGGALRRGAVGLQSDAQLARFIAGDDPP